MFRFLLDMESAKRLIDARFADVMFILTITNSVVNPYVYGSYASEMRAKCFKWFGIFGVRSAIVNSVGGQCGGRRVRDRLRSRQGSLSLDSRSRLKSLEENKPKTKLKDTLFLRPSSARKATSEKVKRFNEAKGTSR